MKIRITVRISRYQREKEWGEMYRCESLPGECFTDFKKRKKLEVKSKDMTELFKQ